MGSILPRIYICKLAILFAFIQLSQAQDLSNLKDKEAFSFSGNLSFTSQFYSTNSESLLREPLSYVISGRPTISIYGLAIPLSFTYSNSDLNYQQPFNQYGIAPSYKWAKALIGYNSISYSKYVLRGLRIKGLGVELTPGKFRLSAFKGTLRKAVDYDLDPTGIGDYNYTNVPAYHQSGYGFKLGIGSNKNYIDLSILKAKDDALSISTPDSTFAAIPIEENTAIGISSQVQFSKYVTLKTELGITAFTNDQNADSVNIADAVVKSIVDPIYTPNESSQYLTALESDLKFKFKKFTPSLNYTRIERDYRTLGSYSRLSDIERYKIKAKLKANKQITLGGSFGVQRNDINNVNVFQNKRFIRAFNLSIRPTKTFFVTGQYSNFGVTRAPRTDITNDTIRYKQTTRNISISPTFTSVGPKSSHTFSINLVLNTLASEVGATENEGTNNLNAMANYTLNLVPQGASFGGSVIYLLANQQIKLTSLGYSLFVSKSFAERKLQLGSNVSIYNAKNEIVKLGSTLQIGTHLTYTINPSSSLSMRANWIRNSSVSSSIKARRELLGNIQFNYQFIQNEK